MREISWLPSDRWNFDEFFSYHPKAGERFVCKCLPIAAVAFYLDIIAEEDLDRTVRETGKEDSIERLLNLLNTYLLENIRGNVLNPAALNLFGYDEYLRDIEVGDTVRRKYERRASAFFNAFGKQFGVYNCADILGFCPFCIEIYGEKKQEWIMEGEWRQKCDKVIRFSVKTILQLIT